MDRHVPDVKEVTENEKDEHPYLGVRHLLVMGREDNKVDREANGPGGR